MFFAGFCLWLAVMTHGTPASAATSCDDWLSVKFFKHANAADVSRCVKAGSNVNERDRGGWTPLHLAARSSKKPALIKTLLKAGADVNARDRHGLTPLHRAAGGARAEAIFIAQFEATSSGIRAEAAALRKGHSAAAAKRQGKLTEATLKRGVKAKIGTMGGGYPAIIRALLKAGANPNLRDEDGSTPLHSAAEFSIPEIVEVLLKAGADPAAKNEKGKTPWDLAKENPSLQGTDVYWRLNEARFK